MKKIVALMGPTAVGKTPLAIELAQKMNAEIICVDSIAVYREFSIGSAKPSAAQRRMIKHHLIDIIDPGEMFSAGDFCKKAYEAIEEIEGKGKRIFLVGGSGLYFRALFNGMFEIHTRDQNIKEELEQKLRTEGIIALYNELKRVDPETALAIHPHDSYRIVRGLEVYYTTGRRFSEFRTNFQNLKPARFEILKIGLNLPRPELHKRISLRTTEMLKSGLLDEASYLLEKYPLSCKPFQSVGYKEATRPEAVRLWKSIRGRYFPSPASATQQAREGKISPPSICPITEALQNEVAIHIDQKTRALARRQLTWFRREPGIVWFEPKQLSEIEFAIKNFLE